MSATEAAFRGNENPVCLTVTKGIHQWSQRPRGQGHCLCPVNSFREGGQPSMISVGTVKPEQSQVRPVQDGKLQTGLIH